MPEIEILCAMLAGSALGATLGYLAAMRVANSGKGKREDAEEIRPYGRDVD